MCEASQRMPFLWSGSAGNTGEIGANMWVWRPIDAENGPMKTEWRWEVDSNPQYPLTMSLS